MVGVIELDTVMVDETDRPMWMEEEQVHEVSANFDWLFALVLRLGGKICLPIYLRDFPSPEQTLDLVFRPGLESEPRFRFQVSWRGVRQSCVG